VKIFLSWSGKSSHKAAQALHRWLPSVISDTDPWLSSENIRKGDRWSVELGRALEEADFGILCLDASNLGADWLVFEAGGLAKLMAESRVAPVLFGVKPSDVRGPLAQFQLTRFSKAEMRKLVKSISEFAGSVVPPKELNRRFEEKWPELSASINNIRFPKLPRQGARDHDVARKRPVRTPSLSHDEQAILQSIAELPDRGLFESVCVDDIADEFSVPNKKAEYYLKRLAELGLLAGRRGEWKLTDAGTAYVVEHGLI